MDNIIKFNNIQLRIKEKRDDNKEENHFILEPIPERLTFEDIIADNDLLFSSEIRRQANAIIAIKKFDDLTDREIREKEIIYFKYKEFDDESFFIKIDTDNDRFKNCFDVEDNIIDGISISCWRKDDECKYQDYVIRINPASVDFYNINTETIELITEEEFNEIYKEALKESINTLNK
jgi:hypothetical protein